MKRKNLIILTVSMAALGACMDGADTLGALRAKMQALATDADKVLASAKDGLSEEDATKVAGYHNLINGLRKTESLLEKQAGFLDHLSSVPPDERRRVALNSAGLTEAAANTIDKFSLRNFIIGVAWTFTPQSHSPL